MSSNFIFLFCVYLFVVQAVIVGILTKNPMFYKLAIVNAAILILAAIIYGMSTTSKKSSKSRDTKKETKEDKSSERMAERIHDRSSEKVVVERKPEVVHPSPSRKVKIRKTGQWVVWLVSLIIAVILMLIIGEIVWKWAPFIASIVGFLLYVLTGKILDVRGFSAVNTLATAWLYYLIIALSFVCVFTRFSSFLGQGLSLQTSLPMQDSSLTEEETDTQTTEADVYETTGTVVISDTGTEIANSTELTDTEVSEQTGVLSEEEALWSLSATEATATPSRPTIYAVTMLEAIKYVLQQNNVPLSKKTDVSFQNLSTSHPDYPYAKTAQEKAMIGKNANVAQQISCGTYMVFKGIVEKWNVGSYTDVKAAYRKKAKELWKLNGCTQMEDWLTSDKL